MSLLRAAAFVGIIATIVVHGPANAAPQMDVPGVSEKPEEIITVAGHQCICIVFHLCSTEDTVKNSFGITEPGCFGENQVCCKVPNESFTTVPINPPSIDLPSFTYQPESEDPTPTPTQTPTPTPTPKSTYDCRCVSISQCLDNEFDIDIRLGYCRTNQICCNLVKNETENGNYTTDSNAGSGADSDNDVISCGIGMLPPNPSFTETRITSASDETYFGQYPWMAIILRTDIDKTTNLKTENVFQCGGSLVHPKFVLTAAHCVRNMNLKLMKVRLGEWHTQSNENLMVEKKSHQDISIYETYIHPDHNNVTMYNDIALIELSFAVKLQPHINTICLPSIESQINYDPKSCVSMGWGKNGLNKTDLYQTVLKKVELSIVPNGLCQQQLRNTRLGKYFNLHESFICAGGIHGEDVCKGDGGGPLVCAVKDNNSEIKNYLQVGIVSWGIGCASKDVPGVYSSVNFNSQWINQHIK